MNYARLQIRALVKDVEESQGRVDNLKDTDDIKGIIGDIDHKSQSD